MRALSLLLALLPCLLLIAALDPPEIARRQTQRKDITERASRTRGRRTGAPKPSCAPTAGGSFYLRLSSPTTSYVQVDEAETFYRTTPDIGKATIIILNRDFIIQVAANPGLIFGNGYIPSFLETCKSSGCGVGTPGLSCSFNRRNELDCFSAIEPQYGNLKFNTCTDVYDSRIILDKGRFSITCTVQTLTAVPVISGSTERNSVNNMSEPYDPLTANPTFYRSSLPGSKPPAQLPPSDHDAVSPRTQLGIQGQAQTQQPHSKATLKMQELQRTLDETKVVMVDNLQKLDERGERLDDINERAGQLSITSQNFRRSATDVRKRMWWKNMKWWICIGVFLILFITGSVVGAIKHKEVVEVLHPSESTRPPPVNPVDGSLLDVGGPTLANLDAPGPVVP